MYMRGKGHPVNQHEYDRIKEAIQIEYEEKLEALEKLKGILVDGGFNPPAISPRIKRGSLSGISDEEKKARQRAYQKARYARIKLQGTGGKRGDEKGLPPGKFKKFLVPGPASAGGTDI